jgi:hypothetical protein
MSGGGGTPATQTTSNDPWTGAQPALHAGYNAALNWLNTSQPNQYYHDSTVSGFTPMQGMGQDAAVQYAQQFPGMSAPALQTQNNLLSGNVSGNPLLGALSGTLGGAANTLNSQMNPQQNPYLQGMTQQAMDQAGRSFQNNMQGVRDETYASGQNIGDTAYSRGLDKASNDYSQMLNNISTNMYGNAYNSDQSRAQNAANSAIGGYGQAYGQTGGLQAQALGLSPQTYGMGLIPSQLYSQVGGQQQTQNQAQLSDLVNRYNYNQNAPYQQLQQYAGLLGGIPGQGGTSVQTSTPAQGQGNPLMGGLGAGAGFLLGGGPYGAMLGYGIGNSL